VRTWVCVSPSRVAVKGDDGGKSGQNGAMTDIQHLSRPDGETLAFKRVEGGGPTVIWVGGFRSDMEGTKALALDAAARERGWSYVRYDHFAHGVSSGDWKQATIGRWREDAVALIDSLQGSVIPVGSSMGGWVALLATLARPERIKGVVLVNPAQDFTEKLMWPGLADHERQAILREGEKKPFDVTLVRAIVRVDAAAFRREGDIGYVRMPGFNEQTADGLQRAVRELKKQIGPGIKGYVLDLRNNPGGLLDQAIQVSDDFLGTGEIVSTRGRRSEDTQRYDAKGGDIADG
jgi:pimeloyl-ACP methyl ester carboxylesterase